MLNDIKPIKIFYFSLIFILLTIVGTQLHELGHYLTAYFLNFEPKLHYASVSYDISVNSKFYSENKVLLIKVAGPLQTIFMGVLGLTIMKLYRVNERIWWIGVFSALFLLRQVFIMLFAFINSFCKGKFIFGGDEAKIARILNFHPSFFVVLLGILSALICGYIFFVRVPKRIRLNFIIGSLIGSTLGFIIWFYLIGKIVLP